MGLMMSDRREMLVNTGTLCFLPSLEVIWPFIWLYLSALGGSGGWVSFSSRPSRLLLDYREESRELKSIQNRWGNSR